MKRSLSARIFLTCAVAFTYLFLYVPIVVLVVFSFNNATFPAPWSGFTWRWYQEFLHSEALWQSLLNSLIVAVSSTLLSCLLGLCAIFYTAQKSRIEKVFFSFYGSIIVPEIVLAAALLTVFTYFAIPLGLTTLIATHTLLGLGFVIPILYTRFLELDKNLIEASQDLGASPRQTFLRVILPLLIPSLLAAALLIFILSFDDFLFAFFCAGSSITTLPLYIFGMLRSGISPVVNALSTVLLIVSSLLVFIFCWLNTRTHII